MLKKIISKDWFFSEDEKNYTSVDLPHDYAIGKKRSPDAPSGSSNGYYPDARGAYLKYLKPDVKRHTILDVDGAYMYAQVFLNEHYIASHPYGYTPFLVDLTPYLSEKHTNKLKITVNPLSGSSRWYPGNGIYRDVFLWEGGDVRIEPWDLFVSTASAEEASAALRVRFTLTADETKDVTLRFTVLSPEEECVQTGELPLIAAAGKTELEHTLTVTAPALWDTEHPNLYTLKTEIFEDETLLDTTITTFGIRTLTADAENGLLLNGKPLKLRGGCIHHDHGVLGAAAFPAAEERKMRRLKETGFNSVRCAHNPPSLAMLECCDRLGIVVMEEAFDCWNKQKMPNDYHLFFEDWWARDIECMVKRDRNHPCIFSYSIGNEILEIDSTSDACGWSRRLSDEIRKYDDTRFVTSGIQKIFARRHSTAPTDPEDYRQYLNDTFDSFDAAGTNGLTRGYEDPLDIVGCNYYYQNYELDHQMYPDRVIWGSETHALDFYDSWQFVKNTNYVIGDYTWTAYDNMGEVAAGRSMWARDGFLRRIILGDYPWRTCYQGDLDLCGYRRPQSYFREAVWLGNTEPRIFVTHPEHYGEGFSGTHWHWYDVDENWTFEDRYIGRPVTVETYTDADEIFWLVNGEAVGSTKPEKGIARFDTIYKKGSITAIACKNGVECSRCTLASDLGASAVNVIPERAEFLADYRDLCFVQISVVDKEGRPVNSASSELRCIVTGGELMGVFSGNPCCEDQYTSDTCHAFKGRALAVIRTANPGKVNITVCAEGLASGHAQVTAK